METGSMPSSSEIQLPESQSNDGLPPQDHMISPRVDEGSRVTSTQPQQNALHYQENTENASETQASDNSHIIEVEREGRSTASAESQQNISPQGPGNMENSSEPSSSETNEQQTPSAPDPPPYFREVSVEDRKRYLELYKAAKDGNWEAAKMLLLDENRDYLLRADLTNRRETILHVATQANQTKFVRKLLDYIPNNGQQRREYLERKDVNENTAFFFAVVNGNLKMVILMGGINENLRTLPGKDRTLTPLHVAALQGKREIAWHLYEETTEHDYGDDGLKFLLKLCVKAGIYDLALRLLKDNEENQRKMRIALEEDLSKESVLHILSRQLLGLKENKKHELVAYLWKEIFLDKLDDRTIMENIRLPSHVVFNAVEVGNFEFLKILISSYPYLIWEVDDIDGSHRMRSIIHIAVLNRQAEIFNFAREIGSIKDVMASYIGDDDGNSLLHMAATLQENNQPSIVLGAAFQMTLELLWFEAVKKMVPPSYLEMKNKAHAGNNTPQDKFTKDHKKLVNEAQSWIKKTTNCCMLVSTLITTGVLTATFSLPGGFNDQTGSPNYLLVDEKRVFMVFSIFDSIALVSSSTSIFIFLSILISRHAEYDFQYTSLPLKLIFGLILLLVSMISMMITFGSAFIMYYNTKIQIHDSHYNDLVWVPIFICVLAFIPIPSFVCLLGPILSDIVKLSKFAWNLSQTRRTMLRWKKSLMDLLM